MAIHTSSSLHCPFSSLWLLLCLPSWPVPRNTERTKEITKERQKKSPIKRWLSYSSSLHSAPGVPTRMPRSRHLQTSPAGFGASLPTSVVARQSKIAWRHCSSVMKSRILSRSLPLPVSHRPSAHRNFCWRLQCGQHLKRCSYV